MKDFFQTFRPALRFLGVFFLVYVIAVSVYSFYLATLSGQVDIFTKGAASAAIWLLNTLNFQAIGINHPETNSVWIYMVDKPVVRVIEGCNGVSVIILLMAFVLAFKGSKFNYLWFLPTSFVSIWTFNAIRISWLAIVVNQGGISSFDLNKSIFNGSIYFLVFISWLGWIRLNSK
jgi:exosortase family protein XrtF